MAEIIELNDDNIGNFRKLLRKVFQSGNINFLIGSGASYPAIPLAGGIEQELNNLYDAGDIEGADKKKYDFLTSTRSSVNDLVLGVSNSNNDSVLNGYINFLKAIEKILTNRKTTILPRQANIFTTNYDLFIEKASENFPIFKLNDGFNRAPRLDGKFIFKPQNYFNSIFNNGNLYSYKVEIPSINLVKIHGSFSWCKQENEVMHSTQVPPIPTSNPLSIEEIQSYNSKNTIIFPHKGKFRETTMDRIYYDLLRIFSNELDKENTLLVTFGFSFADEHINDITARALKNPTLKIIIFCYSENRISEYQSKFEGYNNVSIVVPESGNYITFEKFNDLLGAILNEDDLVDNGS